MNASDWIRRARYNTRFIKLVKFFHLRKYIKIIYYLLILWLNKKIKVVLFGYPAEFYVNSLEELIHIEFTLIDIREREINVLKKIFEVLGRGEVAYDIGASIGTHAIFMAQKVGKEGRVIAFEPEASSYKELNANIALNSLNNIITLKIALGNHFGEQLVHGYSKDSFGLFSLIESGNDKYSQEIELVEGDDCIRNKQLPLPNVVKIDVEGYEYYVINGLKETLMQEKCRLVFCEIHPTLLPKGITSEDVISLLRSYGFGKFETYRRGETLHTFCYKTKY